VVCLSLLLAGAGCRSASRAAARGAPASVPAPVAQQPRILRYDARIALDIPSKSFTGETRILFRSPGLGPRELRFPRNGLSIDGARYEDAAAPVHFDGETVVIPLPDAAPSVDEHVTVAYHATPDRGLVFGEKLVYSDFFTCHWMLCSEEPGGKAAFGLEVVAPPGDQVVASGRVVEEHTDGAGLLHSRWEEERPYSPYLYGFVAGDLTETSMNAGAVRLRLVGSAASESADSLRSKFRDTARMVAFLEGHAGIPLPHDVYTQVLVPGTEAQEKSSFALIGARLLDPILEDPTEDWVIVHELAHQWWGNLVTCRDWSQFWLNEAMATFLVAAYKEERWGRPAYERELGLWRERWKAAKDVGFDVPLAYAQSYPSLRVRRAIQYSKGALFLHTLRARLGDRAFWGGVSAFTRKHAGGTVTSEDLQRAMQEASGVDLDPLFREWVYP
jgi:aminopeptidase N